MCKSRPPTWLYKQQQIPNKDRPSCCNSLVLYCLYCIDCTLWNCDNKVVTNGNCSYLVTTWETPGNHWCWWPNTRKCSGSNQSVRSSAPVVSRCFPGGYNAKLYISRGRLTWWLLTFLHSVRPHAGQFSYINVYAEFNFLQFTFLQSCFIRITHHASE